jgi:cell division protein FtsQ
MSDLASNSKKTGLPTDLGKARQRKLKRQSTIPGQDKAASVDSTRRRTRQGQADVAPSSREQNVEAKGKRTRVQIPRVTNKLRLDKLSQMEKNSREQVASVIDSAKQAVTRTPRRKDARHAESPYQASAHTETQRRSGPQSGYVPKMSRRVYEFRSEANPPVMVRGGLGGMAFGRTASSKLSKRKATKRRIDIPLNVTGAEVRLPSIPLIHIGWRAVSLLMVLMMIASLVLIWKSPTFKVASLKTVGLERLTLSDLNAVVRLRGDSIFTVNPDKIDDALKLAFPELSKVSVKVNLPSKVTIEVSERQPIIAWVQDGKETWVDADGVSFPARGTISDTLVRVEGYGTPPGLVQTGQTVEVQTASGETAISTAITPTLRLSTDLVSAILSLGSKMPPDTLLVYDSEHGLGWNDPKGWDVFFGSDERDMEMKLAVYQSLVERLESEGIQPALISVEYVHAPYYRMER